MKKAIVLALALVLTLSLAVPAAAASTGSPKAPAASETTTASLPVVADVKAEDGSTVTVEMVSVEDTKGLSEEAVKDFTAAQEKLAEAAPAGMKTQYFTYVKATGADGKAATSPVSMSVKVANATKVVAKQFVDGKWVELKVTVNADGTVTIEGLVDGPLAIFTK